MEFRSLGSDFQPDVLIDDYNSVIWTDRYRTAGDFILKTGNIEKTMATLPIDSMVSVKGSTDCKIVESHVIEKDPDGAMELTVSGRSFESFFENRVAHEEGVRMFTLNGDDLALSTGMMSEAKRRADYFYNVNLALPLTANFPGSGGGPAAEYISEMIKSQITNPDDPRTYIPNVKPVIETSANTPAKENRFLHIKLGVLYERILELLAMDDLGIKCVLPSAGGTVMEVRIYAGADKSESVVLSASAGHFEKTSYAFSSRGYKNAAHAFSKWDYRYHWNSTATGMAKRHAYIDAQDIDKGKGRQAGTHPDTEELKGRIASELGKNKRVALFTGEVSPNIPYKIDVDYKIGDIVRVMGDYKINQLMRVSEYTRIDDAEGERAFPALEDPADLIG